MKGAEHTASPVCRASRLRKKTNGILVESLLILIHLTSLILISLCGLTLAGAGPDAAVLILCSVS